MSSSKGGQPSTCRADADAGHHQPDGLLGEEHQGRPTALGSANGDEERHGDPLGILESGGEADGGFACCCIMPPA